MSSLRARLLAWLLSCLGLLWLAVGTGVYVTVRTSLEAQLDAELRAMASEVRHLYAGGEAAPAGTGFWFDFLQEASGRYFEAWDEFELFSDRSPSLGAHALPRPSAAGATAWNFELASGEPVRGLRQQFALAPAGRPGGAAPDQPYRLEVMVACNRAALDRSLRILLAATGGVGLLMIPVSVLIVRLAVGRGLRPLQAFAAQVSALGFPALAERLPTAGVPQELMPVALRLNELMERLKAGLDRERRLNADLAHELRTPVAELTTMAEVALAWPEAIASDQYREVLAAARQMKAIIDSMLLLARWDQDPVRPALCDVDLGEALARAWAPRAQQAADRGLRVERAVVPGLTWRSNPDMLQVILGNLLANAVEYTPAGGYLRVEGPGDGPRPALSLANAVADLEADDVPHLFERFWRRAPARDGVGHAGLGLALAKSCADLLELDLTAEFVAEPRAICFRLSPRAGAGVPGSAGENA